ncbi:hypothetical protein CROQUDRAFT_107255 [Cronartium quercuum f. sp. fusiforme G11]|uniref:Sister chromatid cohesion protein PDS5 n=1 Tax=Cronartium quercuum f. sp. fusiforme G11 TaxID=708437 RepID=A0A9P6NG32_9BASI|nr:hypothetical protein CROQUDRAFT_107255 [Cronartium quercuum f. sp. fusiforme G11]
MALGPPSRQRLQFNQSLVKDAKLTTNELIKRLYSLHQELANLRQEDVETDSLSKIHKELIHPSLLVHKDKTVKALVACHLADMLRLHAPDAPYTAHELMDIFQFFFRQLRNLSSSNNLLPNQEYYMYLVDSIANVQTVVLVIDQEGSEELMIEIFTLFFHLVSTDMPKTIPINFADILSQIISQTSSFIPSKVLNCILAQFQPKNSKANPAAYRLAVDVCNACYDKLQRDVCRYFTDMMVLGAKNVSNRVNHTVSDDEGTDNSDEETSGGGLKQITDMHILIKNIHKACPGLLANVIPQLQVELETHQLDVRLLATQTLGEMFAEQPSSGTTLASNLHNLPGSSTHGGKISGGNDLARQYPSTWKVWLTKSLDISSQVRITVIQSCKSILAHHHHLKDDINRLLFVKLTDPDEKVRLECCKVFVDLEFDLALHHIQTGVLKALGGRVEDKKPTIQQEALKALGRLYDLAYPEIEENIREHTAHFGWIPGVILTAMSAGDPRLCAAAEKCLLEYIIPPPKSISDENSWVDRLITISKYLNTSDLKKLKRVTRIMNKRPTIFSRFLDSCETYNGGIIDRNEKEVKTQLAQIIRHVSSTFPDPQKTMDELQKCAKLNDKRIYKVIKILSDPQTDLKALVKTYQEFNRKIEPLSTSLTETLGIFLRRSAYLILNSASVPTLLARLQHPPTEDGPDEDVTGFSRSKSSTAKILLDMISTSCPVMLKPHIDKLIKALFDASDSSENSRLIDACLLGLSELAKTNPDMIPSEPRLVDELIRYALSGTAEQVKYAATVLSTAPDKGDACSEVNVQLAKTLKDAEPARLVANLSGLSRIAKLAPNVFEAHSETVATFILQNLLMKSSEGEQDNDDDWLDDHELGDLAKARVLGLKLLTNRCLAYADTKAAKTSSAPAFKLFWQLLDNQGSLRTTNHSPAVAMRLRLKAAQSILKLATCKAFSGDVDVNFELLAWMAVDPSGEVREGFISKLVKYLQSQRLTNPRYNVILFLIAHDPEPEIVEMARRSIQCRMKLVPQNIRTMMFESIFVRLLHVLIHHPDFGLSIKDLRTATRYIEFYVDCVADSENLSLLYYLAGQLKTVRDAETRNDDEYLYTISELAQLVIRTKAKIHHWNLPTYPGKAIMPKDIFRPIPSPEIANQIAKKTYLSQEVTNELTTLLTSRKDKSNVPSEPKKPRGASPAIKAPKKAKVSQKRKAGARDNFKPNSKKESNVKPRRTARQTRKTLELDNESDEDEDEASSEGIS